MKKKLQILSTLVSSIAVIVIVAYFALLPKNVGDTTTKVSPDNLFGWKFPVVKFPSTGSVNKSLAYSDIRDPGGIPQGLPVRLKIPIIGVDSAIEDALVTSDGRMDVPAGSVNVAWFALGPHPGQVGSAVIGGHFGIQNGIPFVFYNLDKIKVGDKVYILDDKNQTLAFQVRSIKSFDRNGDTTTVFMSSDGLAHLNLITCEGIWNQINGAYPQRLVVFTDSIPSESAINVKPKFPSTALKTISTVIPSPTAIPTQSPAPQVATESVTSLYATPLDGLITSLLIVSIGFVAFKIIKR